MSAGGVLDTIRQAGSSAGKLGAVSLPLAAWPFLLIPYDSLIHLVGLGDTTGAQTFPATAAFSLVYLALRGWQLKLGARSMTVLKCVAAVGLYTVLLSGVHLAWESALPTQLDEAQRVPTALRQGISYLLGVTTFVMFQDALLRVGHQRAFKWVVWAYLPALLLVPFQAFTLPYRVQGFSTEPSQMADAMVFAFLPACAAVAMNARIRRFVLAIGAVVLISTFSSTGFMKMGMVGICYYISTGRALRGFLVLVLGLLAIYGLLSLWPENYIFATFYGLYDTWEATSSIVNITFLDRYMGLLGPLGMLDQPRAWVGLGYGADAVYFDQIFERDVADAIREVKWGTPALSSLQGKMMLYSGLVGYVVYLTGWATAWRGTTGAKLRAKMHPARFMIPAIFVASLFSVAPFFIPYTWFWLALGATAGRQPRDA